MSGHSHFASIKHKKGKADEARGKAFSKMARVISIVAKEGGGSPDSNYKLRMIIEQAKEINMPKENVERAIKKGTGELAGEKLESFVFEAYGPEGIALIIEGITDNKNRTLGDIKKILTQYNGKLAGEGSVKWMFERKGAIIINSQFPIPLDTKGTPRRAAFQKKEELELLVIEAGAEDIYWYDDSLEVYTKPEDLEKVKKNLEAKEIKIESSSLDWVAKEKVEAKNKEFCEKLFEALDENDDIQNIYSNLKL
jgi:YebC/PmpR family DNA-binding regulatory protein